MPLLVWYSALVTATNSVNSITATTQVTIDVPISNLAAYNNSPTFIGHATAFTATVGSGSNVVYHWNFGDNSVAANGAIASHTYATVGVYSASVTATNGVSSFTATTRVMITDMVISDLVASNSSPMALGISTAFTATVGNGSNVVYQWNFGDGSVSGSGATTSHIYAAIGVYGALVTATNSVNSITATTRVTITDVRSVI